jgi:hypothetical protein
LNVFPLFTHTSILKQGLIQSEKSNPKCESISLKIDSFAGEDMKSEEKVIIGSGILGVFGVLSLVTLLVIGMARSFVSMKHEKPKSRPEAEIPDWVDAQYY